MSKMAAPMQHVRFWCTLRKAFTFNLDVSIYSRRPNRWYSGNSDMGKREYWDTFYAKKSASREQEFDWFFTHDVANQWLAEYVRTTGLASSVVNILELGCGTSTLASNLLKDCGHLMSLVCTDFSFRAIEHALSISRRICPSHKEFIQFVVADASQLPFRDDNFDIVFEKGTFDAMLNSSKSKLARKTFSETVRVLNSQGTLLQFSDENPDLRLSFLEEALRDSGVERSCASITSQYVGTSYGTEYFLYATRPCKS